MRMWCTPDGMNVFITSMAAAASDMGNYAPGRNFIVSLGALCAWMGPQAEALGEHVAHARVQPVERRLARVQGDRLEDWGWRMDVSARTVAIIPPWYCM